MRQKISIGSAREENERIRSPPLLLADAPCRCARRDQRVTFSLTGACCGFATEVVLCCGSDSQPVRLNYFSCTVHLTTDKDENIQQIIIINSTQAYNFSIIYW